MKLGDLLSPGRIVFLRSPADEDEIWRTLASVMIEEGEAVQPGPALLRGETGPGRVRVGFLTSPTGRTPGGALALVRPKDEGATEGCGREFYLLLSIGPPSEDTSVRLRAALADPGVLDGLDRAESSEEVLQLESFVRIRVTPPLRVGDVMEPLRYRVFPDTPLDEVLGLMVRRHLDVLPVVGDGLQVLGVITSGDILKHVLPTKIRPAPGGPTGSGEPRTARSIMSRSVMCVDEDQPLLDAASLMSNRDVAQIPVVRGGEIAGFLTRNAVLSGLFGGPEESVSKTSTGSTGDKTQ